MSAHTSLTSPSPTPADAAASTAGAARADGLEGVVVAHTALSDVDGERGHLVLAGHDVESLALRAGFEDALVLLLDGALPDAAGREATRAALAEGRALAFERLPGLGDALARARTGWTRCAPRSRTSRGRGLRDELARLVGATAVYAAAWARTRAAGLAPIAPTLRSRTRRLLCG
jgi:citrate synthase